jgi:hypothetical protein
MFLTAADGNRDDAENFSTRLLICFSMAARFRPAAIEFCSRRIWEDL